MFLPLFAYKCLNKEMRKDLIEVSNRFTHNVYCVPSFNYPDTTLSFTSKDRVLANDSIYFVPSLGTRKLFYLPICEVATWKELNAEDTLQIFVFDENIMKTQPWSAIVENKMYLKRLTFTFSELQKNDCKIIINKN